MCYDPENRHNLIVGKEQTGKKKISAKKMLKWPLVLFKILPAWKGPFQESLLIFRLRLELKRAFIQGLTNLYFSFLSIQGLLNVAIQGCDQ